ncbi:4Fe-4S cluster-binding domain-containing protein [Candidatus Woesearchaeota archaeon]|nr:4Fe-4S cluster-binding domain-containing protein [Candidatus Woesearchaeota archaeon]
MVESELNLGNLEQELGGHSARDFFNQARERYLGTSKENQTLDSILDVVSQQLRLSPEQLWASQRFQLLFRATKSEHLRLLGLEQYVEAAEAAVKVGRVMSILPYNAVMGDTTLKKYIPSRSDKFSGNWRHSMDPYGIFRGMDRVVAIDGNENETYLATRKFSYAVLANITEACHIGCDGCYKGSMVRTALSALAEVYPEYAQIKKQLNLQEERAERQAELLTQWLNQNQEVDTIVISGGEPTLFSNSALKKILEQYTQAEHVKVVRMCTSSVFQGMWYRIDHEFVQMLQDFESETGKQVYINAHVTDDYQLSAPEARMAVDKLESAGITIHLQMPLQEGINFQRDDMAWSIEKLRRISKLAYGLGVIPYKMIVDMHSPSHSDLTVPIETVTKVIGFLDQHEHHSDHERWQAYNILHEQGNLYLTAYPHFTADKEIDTRTQIVTYFIPKVEFNGRKRVVVHTYQEPLINGHNDNPNSFGEIPDKDIREKIAHVRESFKKLNGDPETTREFYRESGINYAENKPLKI